MSASLHQRLLHESAGTAPALPAGLRLPWRDSATQQLDALEAANRRLTANRIGSNGLWAGIVAATLLLVVVTSSWQASPSAAPLHVQAAAKAPALLPLPVTAVQPQPLPIAQPTSESAPAPDAAALAAIDEAAQQQAARARSLAEARRQAARVTHERALLGKDALRSTERSARPERVAEAPARVEPAAPPTLQPVVHAAPRAGVKDLCSGAGFFGQPMCQARECRKAEHAGDAVCARLREFEQAQARGSDH